MSESAQRESEAIEEANRLISAGKVDDSFAYIAAVSNEMPASVKIAVFAGRLAQSNDRLELAKQFFSKAKTIRRKNPWGYIGMSQILRREGSSKWQSELSEALQFCKSSNDITAILHEYARVRASLDFVDVSRRIISTGPAIANAAVVMMLKDEEDIILRNLTHHYDLGIRNFLLLNNLSSDNTRLEIDKFAKSHPDAITAVVDDPLIGYYQDKKTTAAARFAASYFSSGQAAIEWIIPLDADEFISFTREGVALADIFEAMTKSGASVLVYYLCDATSQDSDARLMPGGDVFRTFPVVSPFLFKTIPKVAFRYNNDAKLHMGNHFVDNVAKGLDDIALASHWGVFVSHFNLRGIEHTKRKFINGGIAYKQSIGLEKHGARWRKNYQRYVEIGERYFEINYENYRGEILKSTHPEAPKKAST